jgi:8-oxo-dGTP pyrophosphatase MutT (NUDIX family)
MSRDDWRLIRSEPLRKFRVLTLREDRYRFTPTGAETGFAVCDSADWVLVIPITVDEQVVFVRQFRPGLGQPVLEIPGGIMEANETPSETAARELQEETGYVAEQIQLSGPLLPNPALNTARFHVAVASECALSAIPTPDQFEQIEIDLRPLASVSKMIKSGELQHALCIAAFAITDLHLQ